MKQLLKNNIVFIMLSLTLFIVLGLAVLYIPKGELHLLLCDRHTQARDIFYKYYTQIAEWIPYAICLVILLFGRVGYATITTLCITGSGLITQLLKHIFNAPRPLNWFATNCPDITLPLVDGIKMNWYLSFPSGHTTTFFALFFILSIISTQQIWNTNKPKAKILSISVQTLFFVCAALGGYSRIYLSQHFVQDILGGMGIGLLITTLVYWVFRPLNTKKWYNYRFFAKKMQ